MTRLRLSLLPAALLLTLLGGCHSKPWARCGQECGSPCWPGPRLGCPDPCLSAPCPPERYCPEAPRKRAKRCRPAADTSGS